jgi:hypothetical protein
MATRPSQKSLAREAARLRRKPGWDPSKRATTDAHDQLRDLDQESRNQQAYQDADACPGCQQERQRSGDPSALCAEHLSAALGF